MNKSERQLIKDVRYALQLHLDIVKNNLTHKARIGQDTLKDMKDGMEISIAKLNDILDNSKNE